MGSLDRLPVRDSKAKLASRVATQMIDEIIARGWPVGEALGSASELADRYGMSRAVFREAVRLLEHQWVVRTQRGAKGGLVVSEPPLDAVTDAVLLYLCRADARFLDVLEARTVLEELVVELATTRMGPVGRSRLEAHIASERNGEIADPLDFHLLLASLAANPALELFVSILTKVSTLFTRDQSADQHGIDAAVERAHSRIARTILTGDGVLAGQYMTNLLHSEADELAKRRAMRQRISAALVSDRTAGRKRAEMVARDVRHVVVAGRLESGHFLGSEPDLLERYGVSRAVFREAVRVLEHENVAVMRRGTGGGLFVSAASVSAVTDIVAIYLARWSTSLETLAELRARIELRVVGLAVSRLDDEGAHVLEEAARLGESGEPIDIAIHDLHVALAALAGNPVLELLNLVMIRLTRFHQHRPLTEEQSRDIERDVQLAHLAIARAVQNGDVDLACKRMRSHLDAISAFLK